MCVCVYMFLCVDVFIYDVFWGMVDMCMGLILYIYIACVCVCVCVYIYIYMGVCARV